MKRIENLSKIDLSMWEEDKEYEEEGKFANYKYAIRNRGIVPIVRNDILFIYKVNPNNDALFNLNLDYQKRLSDINYKFIHMNPDLHINIYKEESIENFVRFEPATYDNLFENFNLVDEKAKQEFIRRYFNSIDANIKVNDNENVIFKKMMKKLAEEDYAICSFKVESKLSRIIDFINDGYIDIDFLAEQLCEFVYSDKKNFYDGTNILKIDTNKIQMMDYTNKEKSLSDNEKINIIKEIIYALNIECEYTCRLDNISYPHLKLLLGCDSMKYLMRFAKHNESVINDDKIQSIRNVLMCNDLKVKCIRK